MMKHQEWNSGGSSSLVDVSSFLLFESTGDSEFDSNFWCTSDDPMDSLITLNTSHQRFLEDDDAQSCSYEECCHVVAVVDDDGEDMNDLDFKIVNEDNKDDDNDGVVDSSRCSHGFNCKHVGWNRNMEDEDEDDDEAGVVEQRWMNGVNKKCKSNYVNSVVDTEFKRQKDKDKLFWETCLAS
ncbi:unnamed protein product [Withania somnifera]